MDMETSLLLFIGYVGMMSFAGYRTNVKAVVKEKVEALERRLSDRRNEKRRSKKGRRIHTYNDISENTDKRKNEDRREKSDRRHRDRRHFNHAASALS